MRDANGSSQRDALFVAAHEHDDEGCDLRGDVHPAPSEAPGTNWKLWTATSDTSELAMQH